MSTLACTTRALAIFSWLPIRYAAALSKERCLARSSGVLMAGERSDGLRPSCVFRDGVRFTVDGVGAGNGVDIAFRLRTLHRICHHGAFFTVSFNRCILCLSRLHAALLSVACMRTLRYKMALLRLAAHHDILLRVRLCVCCTSATLKVNSKLTSTRTSPRTITTLTWMVLSKRPSQVTFCRRSPSRRARRRSWETSHHGVNSGVIQIGSHQLHVHAWASMSDESDESCHLYE